MKKFFMLLCGLIVSLQIASAQAVVVGSENFDGSTHTFTSTPGTAWTTSYNPYNLAVSGTKSIWSEVPFGTGDSVILTSPVYDCSNYAYVSLRFSHICKVSPMDEVRVEFKLNNVGAQWQKLPVNSYKGGAANYGTSGFNAESYSIWNASDSLAMPANSWWKEEMFDLSNDVSYSGVQFRFIIKKGNVSGTQISHGWVIDNFELSASMYEIKPPVVEFLTHYADTVGFTGPYTIKAKVVARTAIPVVHPVLNYTATHAIAGTHTDSVLMTPVEGDSIWEAVIPQHIFGTTYTYFIYGHDTVGNYTLARSGFISAHIAGSGGGMYKYVGDTTNTTTTNYAPYYTWFDYSWSKMLYTSADLPNGTNSISEIAFKAYSLSNTTGVNNQEVYMKVVTDASITNTNYVDPITDGATLVWTGNLPGNIPADTWVNIQLNTPFLVPGGNGVLIYWYNKDGSYEGSTCEWYANTSNNTLAVYNYSDGSMPTGGGSTTNRPIMRIMAGGVINDSNSVGIEDYAMGDSVATSPSTQVPVKLVLRNKGYANLTKATINWTVNGVAQTPYTWTGNIPDDYMDTTIIGTYHPRVNMLDTIVAWTSMPNNVIDTNTFDDTLVKIIYGSSDIVFTWIDAPGDTVYSTGPYLMKLHARTLSGANIDALNMTYTYPDTNNTPISVTVPMTFQGKNMWHAVIPNIRFENPVTYSVTKTDTLGNVVNTNGHYYIKFIGLGKGVVITDSVNYYDANDFGSGDCSFPWTTTGDGTNWSRSIYPSSALGNTNKAINFAGIAYHTENMPSVPHFRYNVLCYAKPTTETYIQTSGSYVDPIAAGATLLFKGDITGITYGWNKVEFDQILTIPQGQNLMIWWIDTSSLNSCSQNTTTLYWDQWWDWSDPMTDRVSYNFNSGCGGSSANYEEWALPFSIFYTGYRRNSDTNSVALAEIVSPGSEGITPGTHPIQAMIRNMGMADLTSCNITYTINNGTPVSYAWTGCLPSDFVDTVTLGTYTAIAGKIDNITMWVDTPNHVYDSTSYDDTLSVDIVVCNGPLDGSYTLGDTNIADFNNMPQFIKTLEKCGIDGKVTLNILPGKYSTGINLRSIANLLTVNDTLIITSSTGDPDDVVFTSGVTLDNTLNIVISNITFDLEGGSETGVNFTSVCDNIEINGCNFMLNTTATGTTTCGIRYNGSSTTPIMGNIRILNNTFSGGGTGIYMYYTYPSTTSMSTANKYITILNNTFNNLGQYGIYSYYYCKYDSIGNNVFNMRSNSTAQYGAYMYYYNRIDGGFFNNKITLNSTSTCYGFYDYYMNVANTGAQNNAPIFNNEIRKMAGSGTFYGIYVYYSNLDVMNNTVYSQGTGTSYNIYSSYANATYFSNVKGNISYTATTGTGYPLYISSATYAAGMDLDYNDYYSTGAYVGYVGSAISSLSALAAATGNDVHSVNVNPQFTNINTNLDFDNDAKLNFMMPNVGNLTFDIENAPRYGSTCMGAYTVEPKGFDLAAVSVSIPAGAIINTSIPVSMEVLNFGAAPISSATINWTINGVTQTPYAWTAATPLPAFESTVITLGTYTSTTAGGVDIKAWFSNVNNTLDSNRSNDTISAHPYICGGSISGIYTVGTSSSNFATLEEAMMALENCGLSGNTELRFASGTYGEMSISGFDPGNYTLTISSATGNASDVKFVSTTGNALNLSSSAGITFKNVTFDASAGTANAVQLSGQITDVTFYGCELLANPTTTSTSSAVVRYPNSSGAVNTLTNVKFIKNHMNGGYYAMYMYYTAGNGTGMLNTCNVIIDSNIIENYYYYGLYSYYYNHYKSISHNTFRTRTGTQATYNMYFYYYNAADTVNGNKIEIRNTGTAYGMYCYYYFQYSSYSVGNAKIINNEIRKLSGAGTTYGMYIYYYMMADVYNNTLLLGGTGTCYGLYLYNTSSTYHINAKNNIIRTATTSTGYPIYISSSTYATSTYVSLDYNDYTSSGSYVGYVGSAQTSITGLRTVTGQDVHSISVVPQWKDSTVDLDLDNYTPFLSTNMGNLATDINGQPRSTTTVMGAYSPELFNGNDIKLESVEGFPATGDFCSANFTDIDFMLFGNGLVKTEFNKDTLFAHLSITGAVIFDTVVAVTTGSMEIFDRTSVSVIKNLNITPAGIYHVTAWISCGADTNYVNDTISFDYIANKVALPIDENFSNGLPLTMRVADNNTDAGWTVLYDSNVTGTVIPATGNAMIAFDGSRGAMTRLFTRQLDFTGTSQPVLDFWYYHDTAATAGTQDYTDVRLTFDGGETFTTLFSVRKNNGNDMGWKQYSYALDSFVNYNCVILVFEAMRMSLPTFDGEQYIDRIKLVSNQDLAVSAIQTSELSACDLTGKELQVVLGSLTGQAIDFTKYPTSLNVTVSGAATATYNMPLTTGSVPALDYDTLVIDNDFDFNPGTYTIKAWIGTPIDKVLTNDTLTQTIIVNPSLNVVAQQNTGGNQATNCIGVGSQVYQVVTITNNGNMDMEDIDLTMNIYDINGVLMTTYTDTIEGLFAINDSVVKTFADAYTVPGDEMYTVEVIANPACNANLTFDNVVTECVDQSDIEVTSIINPTDGVAQGTSVKVTVRVSNNHPNEDAQGIVLHAIVSHADGTEIANWTETMNDITAGAYIDYEFPQAFTVPQEDDFVITAFVNNVDTKIDNDTLVATIRTNVGIHNGDADGISLSQNVPNPADNQAAVRYSIPQDGTVMFSILNVAGQVLYTQEVEAAAGTNSIVFNTENLAAGIYFYTMDFQGQRLMRKMVIRK